MEIESRGNFMVKKTGNFLNKSIIGEGQMIFFFFDKICKI